jgi:hypothetical protein
MSRYGLAEAADLMPPGLRGQLLSVRRHDEHVFLRYDLEGGLRAKSRRRRLSRRRRVDGTSDSA